MPTVTTADLNTLRNLTPHMTKLGLAVHRPAVCVTGVVSSGTIGMTSMTLGSMVTYSTPDRHFAVIAGSSSGASDGGKTRMKVLNGTTLTVGKNNIDWGTYPYVSILKVIEPHTILPDLNNDYEDGDIGYTDENDKYMPVARIGPPAVAILDGAESVTVSFYSNSSALTSRASISSHAWTFPSGSPGSSSSAGSAASPINVTWSSATGHVPHYVQYVVTDSNGKQHARYNPVWVFDAITDAITDFELESCRGDYESGGWTATVRVFGDATATEFPEDAMVCIFAQDWYAGHQASIGGNWDYRQNIVFVGWIARDSVFKDAETGAVTFEIEGPTACMKAMNAWPCNLKHVESPDEWHELHNMTCELAAHHILTQHTTMDHICDINFAGDTRRIQYIDIPEGNPYNQIDEYCLHPIRARLLSDRQGMLFFSQNPNLLPTDERSSIDTVIAVDLGDIRSDPGLQIADEEHAKQVSQVDFIGMYCDGDEVNPYYSLAPQHQYDFGTVEKIDGILVSNQTEANEFAGLFLANLNNIWRELRIPSFNYRIWDIAPEEYTTVTLAASQTLRGLVWSAQKFICRQVELEYDAESSALFVNASFERDSYGASGVTNDQYPDDQDDIDDIIDPQPPIVPPDTPIGDNVFTFDSTNGCWYCPPNSTTWEERNGTRTLLTDLQGGWDPWYFTPEKNGSRDGDLAILWACQAGKIWRSADGGQTWKNVTPTSDPPNTWGDTPAPTVADLTFVVRTDNIHVNKAHYFLARYMNGAGNYRCWLLKTADDCLTWTWAADWQDIVISDLVTNGSFTGDAVPWTEGNTGNPIVLAYDYPAHSVWWQSNRVYMCFRALSATYCRQTITVPSTGTYNVSAYFNRFGNYDHATVLKIDGSTVLDWGTTATGTKTGTKYMTAGAHVLELNCAYSSVAENYGWWDDISIPYGAGMPTSMYPIWMDTDSEDGSTLWITAFIDTTLYLIKCLTTDLSYVSKYSLGAATVEEVIAKTYIAYPRTPPFDKSYVVVYGRMQNPQSLGDPAHIIRTIDGGSSFSLVEGGWGDDHCGALEIDQEEGGHRWYQCVRNSAADVPKFYRGQDCAQYVSDLPFASGAFVLVDAITTATQRIVLASNTPGDTMVVRSIDNGATWQDITNNLPKTGSIVSTVFP